MRWKRSGSGSGSGKTDHGGAKGGDADLERTELKNVDGTNRKCVRVDPGQEPGD